MEQQLVAREDRILFLVLSPAGDLIGHTGLKNIDTTARRADFDSVMSGGPTVPRNLLFLAETRLIDWAFDEAGLTDLRAEILATNATALGLFARLGLQRVGTILLRRTDRAGEALFTPDPNGVDGEAIELILDKASWLNRATS
jgi:RimJ/RimL family protein N-acetyltransferase